MGMNTPTAPALTGIVIDPAAELRFWALGGPSRIRQLERIVAKHQGSRAAEIAQEEIDYMRDVQAGVKE
jgi:hypothetical protein